MGQFLSIFGFLDEIKIIILLKLEIPYIQMLFIIL